MASRVEISGSCLVGPPSGSSGAAADYAFRELATYTYDDSHSFAGAQADAVVPLGAMTSVKALVAYADVPIDIKITHANGTDEVIPLDRLMVIHCPSRAITAIKLNGSASGRLMLAGD